MIRFRNPGTQYTTQVQVFRELYKEYKDAPSFDLDDMAATIAKTKLMTAYGYAGDAALALSNTENDSLNSTKMNAKMYAEVFRLLGWVTSAGDNSYPLVFTYIGEHAALADDVLPLYEQCVLGINNPQEIMDVKYDEKVRFFKATLFSLQDLGGIMYKHELCLGPMSIDDLDKSQYNRMITYLKKLRGSYGRYQDAYQALCDDLGVKPTLPDNSTRLPIAFMKTCGWVESQRTRKLYPPKSLECLCLTQHGADLANSLREVKDLQTRGDLRFLHQFHELLQKSVSHYTLDENGSERLMLKYYEYLLKIKIFLNDTYGLHVLDNIEDFPLDTDTELSEYHEKIVEKICYPSPGCSTST